VSPQRFDLIVEPDPLKIAVAVVLIAAAFVLYRRTLPPLGPGRRAALALLRSAAFALLLLFLLEPAIVSTTQRRRAPVVPVLLDRSRSMALIDGTRGTRYEGAESAAREMPRLLGGASVPVVPFSAGADPSLGASDPFPPADGEGTDIAGALESAAARYQDENLAAIVLLSDGRVTRGVSGRVPPVAVPVFAVGYGDTLEGKGLSVEEVEYPRVTYTGVRERITATIRYSLPKGDRATVRLLDDGTVVDEFRSSELSGEGRLEARLDWAPGEEGIRRLEVRAAPVEGEIITVDNTEQLRVTVLKDKVGILYVDRHPDWDMAFLSDMAAGSPRLKIETVVWSPGRGYRLTSGAQWSAPAYEGALAAYDLVIVGDGEPFAGREAMAALEGYVSHGGGLLLLASERSLLFDAAARDALGGVLPLRAGGIPVFTSGEFPALPAPDGGEILDRLTVPGERFDRLPPLAAVARGFEATAGALVPFVVEAGGTARPLIALQRHGEGICGVIAGVGLYRWRLAGPAGAEAYRVLLSGLIEYLAGGHREPGLEVVADRTVYRAGERIRVDAYAADRRAEALVRGEVSPVGGGGGEPPVTFNFSPDPERPGVWGATLDPLPPGGYEIRGTMPSTSGPPAEGRARIDVEPVSVEMLRTSRDAPYLERIAATTGGALVDPHRLASLRDLIDLEPDTVETRTVRSLRGSALLLAAIVAALAAEWLLRKLWGLV